VSDERLLLVLDEGTSSTRALLYTAAGATVASAQDELTQYYPHPGWVEHDAAEIFERTLACARRMVEHAGGANRIAAIGITNQRETVVAWDRQSGEPLARAIVWQDRRTADTCRALAEAGHEAAVSDATGLVLDPYFSGTKYRWLIDHVPAVAEAGARLALGTVESWLVFKLSGGAHVSDASNASRSLLMPLDAPGFDSGLCELFGVPARSLPEVVDMAGPIATCDRPFRSAAWPAISRRRPSARAASTPARPRPPLAPAPSFSPPRGSSGHDRNIACSARC
jgi:glycerol kinase